VTHAIRKHLKDFIAIVALVILAGGVAGYVLAHQRLRFPLIEEAPFTIKAEFTNAQAIVPGQGQTVRVAGMRVGDIGKVELDEGRAVVRMDLDPKYDGLVRRDATLLMRPRTGLKDMFVELDPGSKSEPALEENDVIAAENTSTDVNPDEVLAMLDADTRDYLKLLISGAGKGLKGRGGDLREVFRRLGPIHRDLRRLNTAVAERRRNLARLVHNYGSTISELSKRDRELTTLVSSSRRVFDELADEDRNISTAVSRLPGTLGQAESTLRTVDELGQTMGPAFDALRPAIRRLDPANRLVRPFAEEAEPILRERVRPFVRTARPYVNDLRPAAENLSKASPDLRESFYELNRLFNLLAYNPGGAEKLTGDLNQDRQRDEGYLFWLGWVAQNSVSLFSTADASGPFRRFIASASCSTLRGLNNSEPLYGPLLGITNLLADPGLCAAD
jgi:phospholipid/cholesterol/gamma-HCH transport system substrate-binding protein